jgi:hypothetical protein
LNFKLITAYPWWFFVACILIGLLITGILYFRKKNSEYSGKLLWLLATIRFVATTLLAFLLMSPMIRTIKRTTVKPAIIIGVDNSSSIVMNSDSSFYRKDFINNIESLRKSFESDYEVHIYDFGQQILLDTLPDFKDQLTDISSLFNEVNTRYFNRNIGAVILASDGIYNSGSDPLYNVRNSKYPVYTINLGDTTSRKDIRIQKVSHNKTAYKGNRFPVEITLQSIELKGEHATVTISQKDNTLFSQEITISSTNQIITVPALLEAKETGLMRLKVSVSKIEGESNTSNNSREIFIEVKESRMKVAIITDSPHPDVAALQRVISNSNNFEPYIFSAGEFSSQKPESFNLIILNQLPSINNSFTSQLNSIIKSKTPLLLIIGTQSNIQVINTLNLGLILTGFKGSFNESLPLINPSFSLFLYTESQKKFIESVPPLISPLAGYNIANSINVFAKQVIGSTTTDMPLILFNETVDNRIGIIAGEGIWKWRIFDYIKNASHSNFDELIAKMFQYLTAQSDKSRFRVDWNNFYAENENIEFNAILFNKSYEPITEPEVTLEIINEQKQKFDYTFSAGDQSYSLRIGTFPPGIYTFEAKADIAGELLVKRGSFVVTAVKLEDVNLKADHKLLNTIAKVSGGKSYYPQDFSSLAKDIKARQDVKAVSYSRKNFTDLIDYYPLMILLILLLGTEWFIRKYSGGY